jgi:hypothetical protein
MNTLSPLLEAHTRLTNATLLSNRSVLLIGMQNNSVTSLPDNLFNGFSGGYLYWHMYVCSPPPPPLPRRPSPHPPSSSLPVGEVAMLTSFADQTAAAAALAVVALE